MPLHNRWNRTRNAITHHSLTHTSILPFGVCVLAFWASACRDTNTHANSHANTTTTGGTLAIATPADADNLLPPLTATNVGREIVDQLFDYLADIGPSLNTVGDRDFTPRLADRWTWANDSLSIAFHIAPNARWHDGVPVTANDVRFTYQLIADSTVASPIASAMTDVDSVSVRDSATAVVWFKRRFPEAFYEFVYNVAVLPEHALRNIPHNALASSPFARHPIGSGRFRFKQWDAGARIEIVSDSNNYRGRATLDRVVWLVSPGMETAVKRVVTGEAQLLENVAGATVTEIEHSPALRLVTTPGLNYGYLGFNTTRPPFIDRAVRRALTNAVDRVALVRNVFDTLAWPGIGPVTRALPTADTTLPHIAYDSVAARSVLSAHPLAFKILVPTSSAIRMKYATLLQEQFRRVGVTVSIDALELNSFAQRLQKRDFDAVLNAWHADPSPEAVVQAWGSRAAHDGPNFTGYHNATFDALVDSASARTDPAAARALYQRAYTTITDDAPAIWPYESRTVLGVARNVRVVGVRADAWWARLADWGVGAP